MKICLKGGTIYDKNHWGERQDLLVEDERILAVGEDLSGDVTVDLSGMNVLPGLFDAHMHIATGDVAFSDTALKKWAQCGVTVVRDLGLGCPQPVEEYLAYRRTIADDPQSADILTCGRFVTAYHGYCHIMPDGLENGIGIRSAQEGTDAVEYLLGLGCEGIKTALDKNRNSPEILSQEELSAIAAAARKHGVWCCAHVLETAYVPMLIEAGVTELAHMPTDHMPDETLQALVDEGIAVTCTICTVNEPLPPLPPMPEGAPQLPPPPAPEVPREEQERICIDNVRRFVKMGGKVAVGTDAMRMETMGYRGAPIREYQLLSEAGLSLQQVITAATANAADVCGLGETHGTIEPGKTADVIATALPIDETFAALDQLSFVMHRGTVIRDEAAG